MLIENDENKDKGVNGFFKATQICEEGVLRTRGGVSLLVQGGAAMEGCEPGEGWLSFPKL